MEMATFFKVFRPTINSEPKNAINYFMSSADK